LALQIRWFDKVAIDNAQTSDARANQQICGRRADRAATDDDCAGGHQPFLTLFANSSKKNLP